MSSKPAPRGTLTHSRRNYFVFSSQYLVLTGLCYGGLIVAPYAAVAGLWDYSAVALIVFIVDIWLLRIVLDSYFTAAQKPAGYASWMTILTIFPPVLGPIYVLLKSLD